MLARKTFTIRKEHFWYNLPIAPHGVQRRARIRTKPLESDDAVSHDPTVKTGG